LAMERSDPAVAHVMLHVIWGSADTNQAQGSHEIMSGTTNDLFMAGQKREARLRAR
jgi:hypothetical protein